jgi:YD repeat-containing protein
MPKLVKSGDDILFYYRGMHKFNSVGGKWVADKTYDVSDSVLTGNWISGFKMTSKDRDVRTFDTLGRIVTETDRNGNTTRYEYNDAGRLAKKITPENFVTEFRYDSETGFLKEVIAPDNKVTKFTHDDEGRIITIIGTSSDTTGLLPNVVTRFTYNNDDMISAVTMPNGETTRYEYDYAKRLSKIVHPDGQVESFVCPITAGIVDTSNGTGTKDKPATLIPTDSIAGMKTVNGNTTKTKYDVWGKPIEIVDALGNATTYVRNSQGQVVEETKTVMNGDGGTTKSTTKYKYDARGNLVKEEQSNGNVSTWEYDKKTNQILKRDGDEVGSEVVFERYKSNVIAKTIFASSRSLIIEQYSYSPVRENKDMIPGGLLLASIEYETVFDTDEDGNTTFVKTDNVTSRGKAYNLNGKVVEEFCYPVDGEQHLAKVNGNGNWTFDNLNVGKRYEVFITWQADSNNSRRVSFSGQHETKGETVFTSVVNQRREPERHIIGSLNQQDFQSIGRITAKSPSVIIKAHSSDVTTNKAANGDVRLVEIETISGYEYDENGRVVAEINAGGVKTNYEYDAFGRLVRTTIRGKRISERYYDYAGRIAYSYNVGNFPHHDIQGRFYDVCDREIEMFFIDPNGAVIDVPSKKVDGKTFEWKIENLDASKRYEVVAEWQPNNDSDLDRAEFEIIAVDGTHKIVFDPRIAAGFHPVAGRDYRSLGVYGTESGSMKVRLSSAKGIDVGTIKVIETQPYEQRKYDRGMLVYEKFESIYANTRATERFYEYDENFKLRKETTITEDETRIYEYDANSFSFRTTIISEEGKKVITEKPDGTLETIEELYEQNENDDFDLGSIHRSQHLLCSGVVNHCGGDNLAGIVPCYYLVVSDKMKDAIEKENFQGCTFFEVTVCYQITKTVISTITKEIVSQKSLEAVQQNIHGIIVIV